MFLLDLARILSVCEGPELIQVCPLLRRMRGRGRGFHQRGGRFQNNQRRSWSRPGMPGHMMGMTSAPPLKRSPKDGDPLGAIVNSDPGQSSRVSFVI